MADKGDKQIESLGFERNGLAATQQQTLLGRQNEVLKLENLIVRESHRDSLGNMQEKFKAFPETPDVPRVITSSLK